MNASEEIVANTLRDIERTAPDTRTRRAMLETIAAAARLKWPAERFEVERYER